MSRWNGLADRRRVVGVAGVDAHAKLELRDADPGDNRFSIPLPSYEASFAMLSVHLRPERPAVGRRRGRCGARHARDSRGASLYGHRRPRLAACPSSSARPTRSERPAGRRARRRRARVRSGFAATRRPDSPRSSGGAAEVLTSLAADGRNELMVEAGAEPAVYRAEIRTTIRTTATWLLEQRHLRPRSRRDVQAAAGSAGHDEDARSLTARRRRVAPRNRPVLDGRGGRRARR